MKFLTVKQLFEAKPDLVAWICKPWLATEAITELDGKAKSAGKTTWALAMCKAILNGDHFLGEKTIKSGIVYLTEESRSTFSVALTRAGIDESADLHLLFWRETNSLVSSETAGTIWRQIVTGAITHAKRKNARVLVIDTFAQFARLMGERENSAGDVLEAMEPLQIARDSDLAVLLIRHERKMGGGVGESGRGSSAMTGVVDIVLRLHQLEGKHPPNYRQLDALSRFDETPRETMIKLNEDGSGYEILGHSPAVAIDAAVSRVLQELSSEADKGLTMEELHKLTGVVRTTLQTALSQSESSGMLTKLGEGKKNNPLRYYRICAETPCV
jgi:hypothetical protein